MLRQELFAKPGEAEALNLNLRQAIINRMKNKSEAELREIIEDSVGNTEMTLPGLGVLFERIWRDSGNEERERMVSVLHQSLAGDQAPPRPDARH